MFRLLEEILQGSEAFVRQSPTKFVAQIQSKVSGKHLNQYLGTFTTAEAAGRAYDDVARLRGEYQVSNFSESKKKQAVLKL